MKSNYIATILGAFHITTALLLSVYGLVFSKSWFDGVIILYFILLVISWTLFNGECLLSYIYKLYKNPNYKAGEDLYGGDILDLIGNNRTVYATFGIFNQILMSISIYIVFARNSYPRYIALLSVMVYLFYKLVINIFEQDLYSNRIFSITNEVVKYYFLLLLLYVIYKMYKKI